MKNSLSLLAFAVAFTSLTGCVMTNSGVSGSIYTSTIDGKAATDRNMVTRKGQACTTGVLGFAWGDASIESAKQNGGIQRVSTVNVQSTSVLGVYAQSCTIVSGE